MEEPVNHFFNHMESNSGELTWIEKRMHDELPRLYEDLWPSEASNICPLTDMGEYCLRILHIIVKFSEILVNGDTIRAHLSYLANRDDGRVTAYMDDKQDILRKIVQELRKTADECRNLWLNSPRPPRAFVSLAQAVAPATEPMEQISDCDETTHPLDENVYQNVSHTSDGYLDYTESEENGDEDTVGQQSISGALKIGEISSYGQGDDEEGEYLNKRGITRWHCPLGHNCDKGGVTNDGELKEFSRHSQIRAHRAKHAMPYKCLLPGCKNKKGGFARKDQLDRHQKDVKHLSPDDTVPSLNEWGPGG